MYIWNQDIKIYYEEYSSKPNQPDLLMIHGVVVDAAFYQQSAELLKANYHVITYDRRGNSRSAQEGEQTGIYQVADHVSDTLCLMEQLGLKDVIICGTSAGAIIALELLRQRPDLIKGLILHEPPVLSLLKETTEAADWVTYMNDLIARGKLNRAMMEFVTFLGETDDRSPEKSEELSNREMNNFFYFLKEEYQSFMEYVPPLAALRPYKDRMVVTVGEKSGNTLCVRGAKALAKALDCSLHHVPGYHNLPWDLPLDYAANVLGCAALHFASTSKRN